MSGKTYITKDFRENSILVSRVFGASAERVWNAFTISEILDQWWGPSPWKAETKVMNFSPGGFWLYAMVGPENQKHWARMNYLSVKPFEKIEIEDGFCDENGNLSSELPVSKGLLLFTAAEGGTKAEFKIIYPSISDLLKIIEMGFEQGISICFDQLEKLLNEQSPYS